MGTQRSLLTREARTIALETAITIAVGKEDSKN